MNHSQKLGLLRGASPFDLLDSETQERLAERLTSRTVEAGESVFKKGDAGDALYIIASGRADVIGPDTGGAEAVYATLAEGESFGEIAIVRDCPRTATVKAVDALSLLRLERQDFLEILRSHPDIRALMERAIDHISIRNFLRQFSALGTIPARVLRRIADALEPVSAPAGRIVVSQGDCADRLYVVKKGALRVVRREAGQDRELGVINMGESFGELGASARTAMTASIVAQEDSELFALSPESLDAALAESPELCRRLERIVAPYDRPRPPEKGAPGPLRFWWRRWRHRHRFVHQQHHSDSGAACLAMALRHYGSPAKLTRIRDLANVDHDGATLWSLAQAAETLGLEARAATLAKEAFAQIAAPAITPWEGAGFILVLEVWKDGVLAADPARGLRRLTAEAFARSFTGRILQLSPTERLKKGGQETPWNIFFSIVRPYFGRVLPILTTSILLFLIGFAGAKFTGFVVHEAFPSAVAAGAKPAHEPRSQEGSSEHHKAGAEAAAVPSDYEDDEAGGSDEGSLNDLLKPLLPKDKIAAVGGWASGRVRGLIAWTGGNELRFYFVLMLALTVLQALMTYLRKRMLIRFSRQADLDLLDRFLSHVMRLPMRYFDLRRVGDVLSRVSENASIRQAMVGTLPGTFVDLLLAVFYTCVLFLNEARLALLVCCTVPVYVLITWYFTSHLRAARRDYAAKMGDQDSYLIESITGIGTVKMMGIEEPVQGRWRELYHRGLEAGMEMAKFENRHSAFSSCLGTLTTVVFLGYGAQLIRSGHSHIRDSGQLMELIAISSLIIQPTLRLFNAWDVFQELWGAIERLNDVFEAETERRRSEALAAAQTGRLGGAVAFEDVSFRYTIGQEKAVLSGICFEIKSGETVAVVGHSGAGKSTLAKLLLGLYPPTQGRVVIDGRDTRTLSQAWLRRRIGVVPQDVFLFSGSIRDNIAPGVENPSVAAIETAARLAGIHDFIKDLPRGYETKIGERGGTLAGGQRQRIALARALYYDPDILLLDEATSALDTDSEKTVHQSVAQALKGRTRVIISHRLSTVADADRTLVLDRGVLVEEGTHASLLQQGGVYARLVSQQMMAPT